MRTAASVRQECLANAARGKHAAAVEAMRNFLAKHGPSYPRLAEDRLSHTIRLCNELALICIQRDAAELHAAHAYLDWACRTSATHSAPIALRAVTLNTAGIYFMRSGAPEVALRCLASAITAGGSNATDDITIHASLNMTTALAEMDRHDEALDTAEEVVRLLAGPRSPTRVPPDPSLLSAAHHNLAVQQQRMGLSETAIQSYRAAAKAARKSSAGSLRPTVQDVDHAARFIEISYSRAKRLPDQPSNRPGTPSSRGTQDPLASHLGPSRRFPTTVTVSTTLRNRMSPPSSAKMRRSGLGMMPMEAMQPTSAADRELLRVALSMVGGAPSTAELAQEAPASLPAPLPAIVGSGTLLVLPTTKSMVKSRTMPQLSRTPGAFRSVAEPSQQASPASSAGGRTMPQLSRTPGALNSLAELSQHASPASSAGAQGGGSHTRAQQAVRSISARREEERESKLGAIQTMKEASSNEVVDVAQAEALRVEAEQVTAERTEVERLVQAMAQEARASDETARMQQEQRALEERVASPPRREANQREVQGLRDELCSQLREALALESQRGAPEFAELMEPELVVTAERLAMQTLEAERTEADELATEAKQVLTTKEAERAAAAATTEVEETAASEPALEPAGTEIYVTPSLGTESSIATSVALVAEMTAAGLLVTGVAIQAVAPPVPSIEELEVEHAAKHVNTEEGQPDLLQELESSQAKHVSTEEVQPLQLQELESSKRAEEALPLESFSAVKLENAVEHALEVAAACEIANVALTAETAHVTSEEAEMHKERGTGQENGDMYEAERLEAKRMQANLVEAERLAAEEVEAERFEVERRKAEWLDAAHADLARAEEDRQAAEKAAADAAKKERGEAVPLAKKPESDKKPESEQSSAVVVAVAEQITGTPVAPEASAAPEPEVEAAAATDGAPSASDPSPRAEEAEPAEPAPKTVDIAQGIETNEEDEVPWTPAAVASAELTLSTAEKLVAAVVLASDEDVRRFALDELRQFTNDAYGANAAAIGAAVRAGGAMAVLVSCVDSSASDLQQMALSLLGNLLTDLFDRHARKSLALFVDAGGLASLQARLRADYPVNLFATATLQNITSLDAFETCARLREQKCADELIAMLHATDDAVMQSYVTAVLANLRAQDPEPKSNPAIEEAIRMRRLASIVDMMQTGKAVSTVQRLASRWLVRHRARKAMEATCGAGVVASTEAAAA